jgi:hypothetical protein
VLEGAEFEKYRNLWWKKVEQYYMLNMWYPKDNHCGNCTNITNHTTQGFI